jgi:hypothetical protein
MASNPVSIATRDFKSQSDAMAFFKAMLNRYKPGDRVAGVDAFDLAALLDRHAEYAEKVGVGIDHFELMMTDQGTQCFRIVRNDGSGIDFSYIHCVRGRSPSRKDEISRAFRQAIRFDLYGARDKFFSEHRDSQGLIPCAVSKARIPPEQGHMDHRPPLTFEVIVITFLEGRGLTYESVPITTGADNQVAPTLTDESLSNAFRQYHARIARLDFVTNTINLAQSARERIRPSRIKIGG